MIKAILFDMDGVLIEAKDWHYDSLNMALAKCGYKPISLNDHKTTFCGLSTNTKIHMLSQTNPAILNDSKKINDLKQQYTFEIAKQRLKPNAKQIDMLSALQSEGYKMAVCSNSIADTISLFLRLAGIDGFFDFTLSNQDVTNQKPHPEIYTMAMQKFNLKPKQCLIIEDSKHGIEAARASGGFVMEVSNIVTHEEIIESMIELKDKIPHIVEKIKNQAKPKQLSHFVSDVESHNGLVNLRILRYKCAKIMRGIKMLRACLIINREKRHDFRKKHLNLRP